MKTFEVVLTKSFLVKILAENEISAKEYSEFFTSDIFDISTNEDRKKYNFEINDIECKFNPSYEVTEL
jgi:hypothetical protein